jgi:hypothetical protein
MFSYLLVLLVGIVAGSYMPFVKAATDGLIAWVKVKLSKKD